MTAKQEIRDNAEKAVYVVPKDTKDKIARAKELQARMKRCQAELDQIKSDLKEEMIDLGVNQYTGSDGAPLVTLYDHNSSAFDRKKAERELGVRVVSGLYTTRTSKAIRIR